MQNECEDADKIFDMNSFFLRRFESLASVYNKPYEIYVHLNIVSALKHHNQFISSLLHEMK